MKPLSLYIHIPFCASKCAYCDFASFPGRERDWAHYFGALWDEIETWRGALDGRAVDTVFFGGGTPTLVDAAWIVETLRRIRDLFALSPGAEISMEGNPGTLRPDALRACRAAGVNRLSLGAQSFDDGLLRALGRIHTAADITGGVRMAREAGFDNLNLDLIYALPGQSEGDWLSTLESAVALSPEHLSAYSLIVEEGTPMAARVRRGEAILPEDDAVNAMQRRAVALLAEAGYRRYEISNYARAGFECRHNRVYWTRGDYLGLGCAAHSLLDGARFSNPESLDEYLAHPRPGEAARLTRQDAMEETILLSTRLTDGLDLDAWARDFGEDFVAGRQDALRQLEQGGYIHLDSHRLRLTLRGMEVQNAVVLALCEQ